MEETEEFQKNVAQAKTSSLLEGTLTLRTIKKVTKMALSYMQ